MSAGDTVLWTADPRDAALPTGAWTANAAAGSHATLSREEDGALRFAFSLAGHGAWAIARRAVRVALPAHYRISVRLRGEGAPAELQLKLVDAGGTNVWWWRHRDFTPSAAYERLVLHPARLRFAWGPRSGGDPDALGAIELAVASDVGAAGTWWIEDLRIEARAAPTGPLAARSVRASSAAPGHDPERVLTLAGAGWRPEPGDREPWLELDLGEARDWGGLVVGFANGTPPTRLRVLGSDDGSTWTPLAENPAVTTREWLRTGESDARFVRLVLPDGLGGAVREVSLVPIELALSPVRFASAAAQRAPRGWFPRHLVGEHAYWAVVGADGDEKKGLLGADGALEVEAEGFSLEPFLRIQDRLVTWADVESRPGLESDALPIPSVTWEDPDVRLGITAFVAGAPGSSTLIARYTATNRRPATGDVRLLVAVRPFQVTPEWQGLNLSPALSPIRSLRRVGAAIEAELAGDGAGRARRVIALTPPDAVGAAPAQAGVGAFLESPLPPLERVDDPLGFAEAAFAFDLRIAPGESETVVVAVPLHGATPEPPTDLSRTDAAAWGAARLAETAAYWHARLARIPIALPPVAAPFRESLRASVAWILVNREGPRIQPGPRCYRRSWIRDGALTGTALAELGFAEEALDFARWYAPHQGADGRVPCAVDRSGIDRAVEHDSHGQLAWLITELWQLTGDDAFLNELWPHARCACDAIAALRAERTGAAFRGDPRFGLLPESISHEGYSSQPVHSYWDDFFALRALADAASAAAALGDDAARERFSNERDALRRDVHVSVADTIERHRLDILPGSVELGDFDPTSTAIAFDPCGEATRLPRAALERTFERYWDEHEARRRSESLADAYTAYEIRNAVALQRLGRRDRALALLAALIEDQRPTGWRQWPEVSTRDPRTPRFLGDLPHGWIASSFLRSVRRLVVDEDRDAGVLVLGAGVPEAWLRDGDGVRVARLPTLFGALDLHYRAESERRVRMRLGGACRPPGGIVLVSPFSMPLRTVEIDGRPGAAGDPGLVALRDVPREVVLEV